jgi:L-ascorbate metabolism protein UlaG (beta-lactamase superfamily)
MRNMAFVLPMIILACNATPGPSTATMNTDTLAAKAPEQQATLAIHPVHHSAIVFEWNGHVLYVDPHDGAQRFKPYAAPDLVLITDIHPDHMDPATLHDLDLAKATIIAPKAVVDQLPDDLKGRCTTLANGERTDLMGIGIEAVPMYNMPDPNDPRHPKGRGNGYVLTMGGQRIYISGDTEDIPEMRALKNIDVAFVCMNLPYTMTVDAAASGVLAFKPKVVYPYHYHNQDGSLSDVQRFKQLVNAGDPNIEVRLVDWYKD